MASHVLYVLFFMRVHMCVHMCVCVCDTVVWWHVLTLLKMPGYLTGIGGYLNC